MTDKPGMRYLIALFLLAVLPFQTFAEVDISQGKALFKNNCASCHNKNMKDDLTGPALEGYAERWADYPREELYTWIRNSQTMIGTGHPRAVELWNEWKPTVMTAFPNLTDDEIENILGYVDDVLTPKAEVAAGPVGTAGGESSSSNWVYFGVFLILGFLAFILARIISSLNALNEAAATGKPVVQKSLGETIFSKSVVSFILFALIVVGGYFTVNNAIAFGRQQNYAPEQPIAFSHELHAGLHQIDCQYCHDGARRSKHSIIPAVNTCMNCHKAIKKGSETGTAEITKIFASIGYNPSTDKYMENYDAMDQDSIAAVFKQWIGDQYTKSEGLNALDANGQQFVEDQWNDIVGSLTNELKPNIQGPIEWIRIHNLPDHVYFNHAQHVTVGEVECQTCHGKVEEMEVVAQHSPLSMGWCINCHRETEVKFANNEYYKSYEKYHEELANGDRDKVTVEDIGGLECQKCHY